MKQIKAIFIDPMNEEAKTVELNIKDNDIILEDCYKLLECDLVEFVYFDDKEILIVDEEGLLKENRPFKLEGVGQQYFMGKALIVQEKGERCVGLDEDKIENLLSKVSFPTIQEVGEALLNG